MITKAPYKIRILKPSVNDIRSETSGYSVQLIADCDIETNFEKGEVYEFTHKVWIWNDSNVVYKGKSYSLLKYMELEKNFIPSEGNYVEASYSGKNISGEIRLYAPSSHGIMLGIDVNRK